MRTAIATPSFDPSHNTPIFLPSQWARQIRDRLPRQSTEAHAKAFVQSRCKIRCNSSTASISPCYCPDLRVRGQKSFRVLAFSRKRVWRSPTHFRSRTAIACLVPPIPLLLGVSQPVPFEMRAERPKPLPRNTFKGEQTSRSLALACSLESISRTPYPSRDAARSEIGVAESAVMQGLPGTIEVCDGRQCDRCPALHCRNLCRTSISIESSSNSVRESPNSLQYLAFARNDRAPHPKSEYGAQNAIKKLSVVVDTPTVWGFGSCLANTLHGCVPASAVDRPMGCSSTRIPWG